MPRRTESPPVLQLRKAFRFEAAHRLPRVPAAETIRLDAEGRIEGLF